MYPTCIAGAVAALLLPNVFRQVAPERSFLSPLCYRFFLYHTMLVVLGVIIVRSGEIRWKKRHFKVSLLLLAVMGVSTLYLNSLFSSPTYLDGELVSVDYATNFFYTYKNPLGIPFRTIWQWRLYMLGYAAFAILVLFLFYYPLAFYQKRADSARDDAPQNENTDAPCPAQNAER